MHAIYIVLVIIVFNLVPILYLGISLGQYVRSDADTQASSISHHSSPAYRGAENFPRLPPILYDRWLLESPFPINLDDVLHVFASVVCLHFSSFKPPSTDILQSF